MNEAETRAELIDPALKAAGWGVVDGSRVRREVITLGRLQGAGKRSKQEIADYVLTYRGQKLAVIEAKRLDLPDTEGVGQAKKYAEKLQTRFTYSTNGVGIYQIDMATGAEEYINQYPSPEDKERLKKITAEVNEFSPHKKISETVVVKALLYNGAKMNPERLLKAIRDVIF